MSEPVNVRTITETVLRILEDFGDAEPKCFIAVWLDDANDLCMSRTHTRSSLEAFGLLEGAKLMIGRNFLETPSSDELEKDN